MACWGSNFNGELDFPLVDNLNDHSISVYQLVAGREHFCAIFNYLSSVSNDNGGDGDGDKTGTLNHGSRYDKSNPTTSQSQI